MGLHFCASHPTLMALSFSTFQFCRLRASASGEPKSVVYFHPYLCLPAPNPQLGLHSAAQPIAAALCMMLQWHPNYNSAEQPNLALACNGQLWLLVARSQTLMLPCPGQSKKRKQKPKHLVCDPLRTTLTTCLLYTSPSPRD